MTDGMKFFTYTYSFDWPYLMVKISKYLKLSQDSKDKYKEIFIDLGVYDLGNSPNYSWEGTIDIKEFIENLPKNHYFSFDYPGDMNPYYKDLFLLKSWENAIRYCYLPQYITTVQYPFNDYINFQRWFDKYNKLNIGSGIIGLGNICKQRGLTRFLKYALPYAFKNCSVERIHIYGLNKKSIPYAYRMAKMHDIKLSIDSRKWEYYKPSSEREFWFHEYIKEFDFIER